MVAPGVRQLWRLVGLVLFFAAAMEAPRIAQNPTLPPRFVHEVVYGPVTQTTGFCFDPHGHLYVWLKLGQVWVYDDGVQAPAPLIDIREEIGNWADHGLHGFALDPDYDNTGYVYLFYVVDYHHLAHFGTPSYDPEASEGHRDTIARIVRYQVLDPLDPTTTVDYSSRTILVGEDATAGIPICSVIHGIGQLVFAVDGTLLASAGDSFGGHVSQDLPGAEQRLAALARAGGPLRRVMAALAERLVRNSPESPGSSLSRAHPFHLQIFE